MANKTVMSNLTRSQKLTERELEILVSQSTLVNEYPLHTTAASVISIINYFDAQIKKERNTAILYFFKFFEKFRSKQRMVRRFGENSRFLKESFLFNHKKVALHHAPKLRHWLDASLAAVAHPLLKSQMFGEDVIFSPSNIFSSSTF